MFIRSPCPCTNAAALLVLLACNAYSQSPDIPQTAPDAWVKATQAAYTTPSDPGEDDRVIPAVGRSELLGNRVQPAGHSPEAFSIQPVNIQPFAAESQQTESQQTEPPTTEPPTTGSPTTGSLDVEPVRVEPLGEQLRGEEPFGVEPLGVEPVRVESLDAESLDAEFLDAEISEASSLEFCDCAVARRNRGNCPRCRNRLRLMPSLGKRTRIGGWLEQGFTGNFGSPSNRLNRPLLFNDRSNDYRLNQLYFYAEKSVFPNRYDWDLGGRVDVLLGTDARFLTVPGLEEHRDRTPKWNSETDDYGLAVPQAYVELAAPWLGGSSLKAGHFYSIAGYETAAPPENFFYSHAYTFTYGEPFTHTGALLTTQPSDRLKLQAGYTNGWDVWDSLSDEYGILGGFTLTSADQRTSLATTVISGKDVTSARVGGVLVDEDRHFYSMVLQHKINEHWRYIFQHDFGYQDGGAIVVNTGPNTITLDDAKWYGINQYLIHDINSQVSTALRVEWFRDQDNSRLGIPVVFNPGGPTFRGGNYVGVTGGFNWRPNCNITIRPELRWDYSDVKGNAAAPGGDPDFRAFDDNTSSSQGTAALDVIVFY